MKSVIIYILAILTTVLSLVPCSDSWDEHSYANESDHQQEHLEKDIENPLDFDMCSPFCPCGCCGITVMSVEVFQFEPIIFLDIPAVLNSTAQTSLVDSFLFDLLDPPKYA